MDSLAAITVSISGKQASGAKAVYPPAAFSQNANSASTLVHLSVAAASAAKAKEVIQICGRAEENTLSTAHTGLEIKLRECNTQHRLRSMAHIELEAALRECNMQSRLRMKAEEALEKLRVHISRGPAGQSSLTTAAASCFGARVTACEFTFLTRRKLFRFDAGGIAGAHCQAS